MPSEFELIRRFFTRPAPGAVLGVGDDAALLRPTAGMELAVTTDMLLVGRHFLVDADPHLLGHKALAVNLSDLAAMGATPRWATLALALPQADEDWLEAFSRGFLELAARFAVDLVGGDTTRGPLNISVTLLGEVPAGQALRRDGARVGDDIWVSGQLGGAALGLCHLQAEVSLDPEEARSCLARLHGPQPRVDLGLALRGLARGGIDISDGFAADLGHVLARSGVGAEVLCSRLPAHAAVLARLDDALARQCLLAGGDDYELCFTAPAGSRQEVHAAATRAGVGVRRVGRITMAPGLRILDDAGRALDLASPGYDHFA